MRRFYVSVMPELALEAESSLMERNPTLCGLLLFRLQLKFRKLGLKLATAWGTIAFGAQLVVACRHSGNPAGESGPSWPDMDKVLEMHGADIFGGTAPENLDVSLSAWLRASGANAKLLQEMKAIGTGSELPYAPIASKATEFKPLRDHSHLLHIFEKRFLGTASGTCIDINVVQSLLQDLKAREEVEEQKRERKEAAASGGKSAKRKLPRKERSRRGASFSITQLLAVLEAGLRSESESIRFDYVSMHLGCLQVFRAIMRDLEADLRREVGVVCAVLASPIAAPMLAGFIISIAAKSRRIAEQMKLLKHGEVFRSKLLFGATEAIKVHFAALPGEATIETSRLVAHRTDGEVEYITRNPSLAPPRR